MVVKGHRKKKKIWIRFLLGSRKLWKTITGKPGLIGTLRKVLGSMQTKRKMSCTEWLMINLTLGNFTQKSGNKTDFTFFSWKAAIIIWIKVAVKLFIAFRQSSKLSIVIFAITIFIPWSVNRKRFIYIISEQRILRPNCITKYSRFTGKELVRLYV